MRLDGGHPALDLVNTVYGQVGGPVEHDVLAAPADLVTFARRVGLADDAPPRAGRAAAARRARRARRRAARPARRRAAPRRARPRRVEAAARAALAAGGLTPHGDALAWTWPAATPQRRCTASRTPRWGC